jgi:predicted ABC-type ATPase
VPALILLAGPNGAGKSTLAPYLLHDALGVEHFVNADEIARGLSAYSPQTASIEAGRAFLDRMQQLSSQRVNFAVETTLAGRTLAAFVAGMREKGFKCHVAYVWPGSPEVACERVLKRVASGGHSIPRETILRRYWRSLHNFATVYCELADSWILYHNEVMERPNVVAKGAACAPGEVLEPVLWRMFQEQSEWPSSTKSPTTSS